MPSINQAIIVGNLTADPELKITESGKKYSIVSIATNKKVKEQNYSQFHNVQLWNQSAKFACEYAKKGDLVSVVGEIQYSKYEKDGVTRYSTKIVTSEFQLLKSKDGNSGGNSNSSNSSVSENSGSTQPDLGEDEELPF